jgi:hypothetical protein
MYLNITVKPFVQLIHANKINLKITAWAGDVTEVVEHMLSKLKALSSNHSTTKKNLQTVQSIRDDKIFDVVLHKN